MKWKKTLSGQEEEFDAASNATFADQNCINVRTKIAEEAKSRLQTSLVRNSILLMLSINMLFSLLPYEFSKKNTSSTQTLKKNEESLTKFKSFE